MRRFFFFIFIGFCIANSAAAQVMQVQYVCNIEGQRGVLRASIETVGGTGILSDGSVIGGQGVNTWVNGDLRTNVAYYTFTGENQFAEFTDQSTYARFRVQWVSQGNALTIIVNPFGDAVRYYCERTR